MAYNPNDFISAILAGFDARISAKENPAATVLSSSIVQIGDSIPFASRTSGYSAIKNMGYDASLVSIDNGFAQDGHSLAQIPSDVPGGLASRYDSTKRNIAIIQRVTNDLGNNQSSAAACIALTKTQVNLFRAQGFYVGVGTCLPRSVGSFNWTSYSESQRQIYNAWVVANAPTSDYSGHDFVLDFAADATMGASNAPANTALYSDGTHPTSAGQDYLTPIYRNAVKSFLSANVRAPASLVTLSGNVSQNEGQSGTTPYTFTATRTVTGTAINVPWAFSAGSTTAADYIGGVLPTGGTLAFSGTDTTKSITINVAGDAASEGTETFSVALQAGSGYYLGTPFSANGTLVEDDATATWTTVNDYIPSGGPIAAGAAGTAPNSGGWIDVNGSKWSVDSSNRFIGVTATVGHSTAEAKSPMTEAVNNKLTATFVLAGGQTAIEFLLRYKKPGASTTAYGVAVNGNGFSSTAGIILSKIIAGTKTTLASASGLSSTFVSNTTYVLVASVYSADSTSTAIAIQLFQSDGVTPVANMSISVPADTTSGLQAGTTGSIGVWVYGTASPIIELVSATR